MTAKREAELETENRMLREQVASLEKIVEQVSRPAACVHGIYWTAAQPWYGQYPTVMPLAAGGTITINGETLGLQNA